MPRVTNAVADLPQSALAKSDRHAAREALAAYHERQLAALVERVSATIDCYRDGELDALGVDEVSDVGQVPQ